MKHDAGSEKRELERELIELRERLRQLEAAEAERALTEEALRASEERYRTMVESSLAGIHVHQEGIVMYANPRIIEMLGYDQADAVLGRPFWEFVHPEDREVSMRRGLLRERGQAEPGNSTLRALRKDGSIVWLETRSTQMSYHGRPAAVSTVIDITDRKVAEQALLETHQTLERRVAERTAELRAANEELRRETAERRRVAEALRDSEEKFRHFFESSPAMVYVTDRSGRILDVNEAGVKLLGFSSRDELTRLESVSALYVDPRDRERFQEIVEAEGSVQEFETQMRRKDTTIIDALITATVRTTKDGRVEGYEGFIVDVTDRKAAEEALRYSEEKYRTVVEQSLAGIYVIRQDRFRYVNSRLVEMLGYERPEDVLRRPFWEFIHPDDRAFTTERVARRERGEALAAGSAFRLVRRDGSLLWVESRGSRIMYLGQPAVLGNVVDITDRKRAEDNLLIYHEQLRSLASELASAEERERRRIAVDLHDRIGQNLAICTMKLGALREMATSMETAAAVDQLCEIIDQTIQETRSLTFDLSLPVLYELGLGAAVRWLAEQMQQQHGIAVEIEDDGCGALLDEDVRTLLFRAVRELLMNVVKHARVRSAKASLKRAGDTLTIEVEDAGVGFQAPTIDPAVGLTEGFGLFSIRERLRHLGGRLEIVSEHGHGTRATLVAPLRSGVE